MVRMTPPAPEANVMQSDIDMAMKWKNFLPAHRDAVADLAKDFARHRIASTPSPSAGDLEAIARIIDPDEWALDDLAKTKGERAQFVSVSLGQAAAIAALTRPAEGKDRG